MIHVIEVIFKALNWLSMVAIFHNKQMNKLIKK